MASYSVTYDAAAWPVDQTDNVLEEEQHGHPSALPMNRQYPQIWHNSSEAEQNKTLHAIRLITERLQCELVDFIVQLPRQYIRALTFLLLRVLRNVDVSRLRRIIASVQSSRTNDAEPPEINEPTQALSGSYEGSSMYVHVGSSVGVHGSRRHSLAPSFTTDMSDLALVPDITSYDGSQNASVSEHSSNLPRTWHSGNLTDRRLNFQRSEPSQDFDSSSYQNPSAMNSLDQSVDLAMERSTSHEFCNTHQLNYDTTQFDHISHLHEELINASDQTQSHLTIPNSSVPGYRRRVRSSSQHSDGTSSGTRSGRQSFEFQSWDPSQQKKDYEYRSPCPQCKSGKFVNRNELRLHTEAIHDKLVEFICTHILEDNSPCPFKTWRSTHFTRHHTVQHKSCTIFQPEWTGSITPCRREQFSLEPKRVWGCWFCVWATNSVDSWVKHHFEEHHGRPRHHMNRVYLLKSLLNWWGMERDILESITIPSRTLPRSIPVTPWTCEDFIRSLERGLWTNRDLEHDRSAREDVFATVLETFGFISRCTEEVP